MPDFLLATYREQPDAGTNGMTKVSSSNPLPVTVASTTALPADVALADDAAFTPGTTKVIGAGFTADEAATDSVNEGDIGAARMTLDRKVVVAEYAHTAGGCTPYSLISANTTNATVVKASAGQVYTIHASNTNAAVRYLKLYNKATTPDENDTPVLRLALRATSAETIHIDKGLAFATGIAFRLVTGIGDSDTNAVAASEHVVNLAYA